MLETLQAGWHGTTNNKSFRFLKYHNNLVETSQCIMQEIISKIYTL